uniref:Uncharacterized protein n=1 Tax=Heterorhabditis bacteriophora TaxID=37862 RepID=A0A1I7X1G1_HETBA
MLVTEISLKACSNMTKTLQILSWL